MILVLDNYDSFTYNLVQMIGEITSEIEVHRNDKITVERIRKMHPDRIIISPGPGRPENAGITISLIQALGDIIPILGVCLGHQSIAMAYGGNIVSAPEIIHGKPAQIFHSNIGIFQNVPIPFDAIRYHSLLVERSTLPDELTITAETESGLIMGLRHKSHPVNGVQFHPESILTRDGITLIRNFMERII